MRTLKMLAASAFVLAACASVAAQERSVPEGTVIVLVADVQLVVKNLTPLRNGEREFVRGMVCNGNSRDGKLTVLASTPEDTAVSYESVIPIRGTYCPLKGVVSSLKTSEVWGLIEAYRKFARTKEDDFMRSLHRKK